ncbi:LPS export ABC transporter periplasmic protein LptC [Candidatus Saganbacteria bacterium]|nr:LPS export ABC transporter periplasmic protein LptC [Candidatus Saganbacteria bacterium]
MEFLKRLGFSAFVLFILFLFVWALYLPKEEIATTISRTLEQQRDRLDLFFQGVTFQESSNGVKYWEIKAKSSSLNNTTGLATLEEATGYFYESGRPALKFISPRAFWQMDQKEIYLENPLGYDVKSEGSIRKFLAEIKDKDVSVFSLPARYRTSGEGTLFKAKRLSWRMTNKKLLCEGGIWLNKGEITGTGDTLQADVGLKKVLLLGHPRVVIMNEYPTQIVADEFEVDSPSDTLLARGRVEMQSGQIKVSANKAVYDQRAQTVTLTGNTRIYRQGSWLSGKTIVFSVKEKTFKVQGQTRVVIPEEEIK